MAAYYATRLGGAPPLQPVGGNVPPFSGQQTRALQALLVRRGFEVGGVASGMAAHGTLDSGHMGAAGYNVSCAANSSSSA